MIEAVILNKVKDLRLLCDAGILRDAKPAPSAPHKIHERTAPQFKNWCGRGDLNP